MRTAGQTHLVTLSRVACTALITTLVMGLAASPATAQRDRKGGGKDKPDLPLEAARIITFTTDEVTWLSLDVTPDGESIVFELLGDLYTLPIAGGEATRITTGMAYDSQPRVSPDGKWIAFISDRNGSDNLWIAALDGSDPRKLTSEKTNAVISPTWTADSQYVIVARRGRNAGLRMHHIDGGSGVDVGKTRPSTGSTPAGGGTTTPTRLGAVASPDGRYLYFAEAASGGFRPTFPRWQIGRMDMRSGDVDTLTQADYSAVRPALSPDGRQLVYATRHETQTGLRIRDLERGTDRWLIWPVQRDEIESGGAPSRDAFPGYAFTADGDSVLITAGGKIWRVDIATGDPTEVPFSAEVELEVGPDLEFPYPLEQGPVRAKLIQDPQQSPDGNWLAMSVLTKIWLQDLPDGEPRRLTADDAWEFKPAWSPDGEWIAYVTWSMFDGGHIWKTRSDGSGNPQRLTADPAFYTDIAFTPDGERIVGLRGNEFMRHQTFSEFGGLRIPLDLVWLPAAGGDISLITPGRGIGAPHVGRDPDRVFVYSSDGLISMRYDGTDRRTHLKVTGPSRGPRPAPAARVLMRPDGRWALAAVGAQLWLVAVPVTGGEPTVSVRGPSVPAKRLTDIGADYFAWADGGDTITWAIGSTFYRRAFDSIELREADDEEEETGKADGAEAEDGDGAEPGDDGDGADPDGEEAEDGDGPDADDDEAEDDDGADPDDEVADGADNAQDEDEQSDDEEDEEAAEEPHVPLDEDEAVEAFRVELEFPRAKPEGTIVLRHATIITMAGDEVIADGDVVVTDNRIAAVGSSGSVEIPAGAREIDASGKYIVPGFIDTHAHWEFRTHDVLEPQNWTLIANLAYGVTAGLDVQTSTNDYFAYQDLVETGQSIGQRALMTGPGVFSNNDFQSYEAVLDYLRRYKDHYRTHNIKSYMVGNRRQRQWVVKAAAELGLIPTTEGGRDMKLDLTHAIDGMHGNEHTLPVIPFYDDVVQLFVRTKTAYTPTLLVQYGGPSAEGFFYSRTEVHDDPKLNRFTPHNRLDVMSRRRGSWVRDDEFSFDEAAAQAAKIQRAGGLVGVGGHGQLQGLGYHWEMWALAMGGMTPHEVLQAATIDGAEIIGIQQDLGSIEAGKLADLVVLDANPLEDIHNTNTVRWVMKNGELYEGDTLDQIWPVQRELPRFWWWDAGPTPATITEQ